MKRLLTIAVALFMMTGAVCAQNFRLESGSLDSLRNVSLLNIDVDFDKGVYKLIPEKEFAGIEPKWELIKEETTDRYIEGLNKTLKLSRKVALRSEEQRYTIRLNIISVSDKGDTIATVDILDKDGKTVAHFRDLYADGGVFGTFCNLMGDGLEEAGEKIGRYISYTFVKKNFKERIQR